MRPLDSSVHPDGYLLPCCFHPKDVKETDVNLQYISDSKDKPCNIDKLCHIHTLIKPLFFQDERFLYHPKSAEEENIYTKNNKKLFNDDLNDKDKYSCGFVRIGIPQSNDSIIQLFMKLYNENINTEYLVITKSYFLNLINENIKDNLNLFSSSIINNSELYEKMTTINATITKDLKSSFNLLTFKKNDFIKLFKKLSIIKLFNYYFEKEIILSLMDDESIKEEVINLELKDIKKSLKKEDVKKVKDKMNDIFTIEFNRSIALLIDEPKIWITVDNKKINSDKNIHSKFKSTLKYIIQHMRRLLFQM